MGAVIAGDHIAEPFLHGKAAFNHGFTFGGHPVACAVALGEHRRDRARGPVRERARERGRVPRDARRACATCRSSATSAARATSTRSSWSRTRTPRRPSTHEESEHLLRGFLSGELYRRGLICRTDDRGDPIVQLSPPLIAGPAAVRGDRGDPAPRPHRGLASGWSSGAHCREPDRRARTETRLRSGVGGRARPLGAQHRAARPDAVAQRRRGAAHDGDAARRRPVPARVRRAPGRPRDRGAGLRHGLRPQDASRRRS